MATSHAVVAPLIISLMLTLSLTCAKKRDKRFAQGQGINLEQIEEINGKSFDLLTGENISSANETRSSTRKLDAPALGLNLLNIVSYETKADLLGDVPFRGRENHKYEIRYILTERYLKVVKVAPARDIPYLERPYGSKVQDGLLAIPLVGYHITGFYRLEQRKNNIGEKTNIIVEIHLPSSEGATHVRVDYNSREVFEAIEKIDVYPSRLFKGEWYYSETVIDTSVSQQTKQVNGQSTFEGRIASNAPTIVFRKGESEITAIKKNYDPQLKGTSEVNDKQIMVIPVEEWVDYRAEQDGEDSGLQDERVYNRPWSEREFAKVRFDRIASTAAHSERTKLVDLEMTNSYFAFTIHLIDQGIRVRYSLKRKTSRGYQARLYHKDDRQRIGFFKTTQDRVTNPEDHTYPEDFEQYIRLNRFDPERDIVWYFARNSPKYARDAAREAVANWDAAFKLAGFKKRIYIEESKDVALGDLRYNVINLIDTVSSDRLLGFGPTVNDPETGEVIAATTNIYLRTFRANMFNTIRQHIDYKSGIFQQPMVTEGLKILDETAAIFGAHGKLPKTLGVVTNLNTATPHRPRTLQIRFPYSPTTMRQLKGDPSIALNYDITTKSHSFGDEATVHTIQLQPKLKIPRIPSCQFAQKTSVTEKFFREIENRCPEVNRYIEDLTRSQNGGDPVTHLHDEKSVIESCYQKLVHQQLVAVILHELGHNFGLRHNFRASTDKKNFYTPQEAGSTSSPISSSVMDYLPNHADNLLKPGKYDIAAIRYGYSNHVEADDGTMIELNPSQSIAVNLDSRGKVAKHYHFCTDQDIYLGVDPLCEAYDVGTTPLEIVANYVRDFELSFKSAMVRMDRVDRYQTKTDEFNWKSGAILANFYNRTYFMPIKRFYDEWRFKLREALGPHEQYLEMYGSDYRNVLNKFDGEDWYQRYRPVADLSYQFFKRLSFLQPRSCIVDDDGEIVALDFDHVLKYIQAQSVYRHTKIKNCQDVANETDYFTENGFNLVNETGYPVKDYRFFGGPNNSADPFDVAGVEHIRGLALQALMQRADTYNPGHKENSIPLLHVTYNFFPNFLDEPHFREEIAATIANRILDGADIRYKTSTPVEQQLVKNSPQFHTEKDLLKESIDLLYSGLQVPNRRSLTEERWLPYMSFEPKSESELKESVVKAVINNRRKGARVENHIARKFFTEYNRLGELHRRKKSKITEEAKQLKSIIGRNGHLLGNAKSPPSYASLTSFINGLLTHIDENTQLLRGTEALDHLMDFLHNDVVDAINGQIKEKKDIGLKGQALQMWAQRTPIDLNKIALVKVEDLVRYINEAQVELIAEKDAFLERELDYNAQRDILRAAILYLNL